MSIDPEEYGGSVRVVPDTKQVMSRSLHTDPYPLRAARRAAPLERIDIRAARPRPGFRHPAGTADVARLLEFFGPTARYGLRRVELRQRTARTAITVAKYVNPGLIVLFEQPDPPWFLPGTLSPAARQRLERAGARVSSHWSATCVEWTDRDLRDFILFDGLMHEIGHHVVEYDDRRMRTADHERRARAYATECRTMWAAAGRDLWAAA